MRFGILTAAAIMAATGSAAAQEIGDWSGFYAGVYAGYGADNQEESSNTATMSQTDDDSTLTYEVMSEIVHEGAFMGEVRAGYNYQQGALILGVEGSLGTGGFSKQGNTVGGIEFVDEEDPEDSFAIGLDLGTDMEIGAIGTATAKIGFVTGDWLFYGKGGLAVTNASTSTNIEGEYSFEGEAAVPFTGNGSTEGLLFGSTFAIGAETRLTEQLSFGAELGVTNFGMQDVTLPLIELPAIPIVPAAGSEELDSWNILSAKVGLNYRF